MEFYQKGSAWRPAEGLLSGEEVEQMLGSGGGGRREEEGGRKEEGAPLKGEEGDPAAPLLAAAVS